MDTKGQDGTQNRDKQTEYSFYAMLDRMQYINRWGLMRNNRTENIKEHSMDVAIIAHALAVIHNGICLEGREKVDPLRVMGLAIFHDATEIITGDLPTPIKYHNPDMTRAYKEIEGQATETLLSHLPENMRADYRSLMSPDRSEPVQDSEYHLVKAADRICAYIKCVSEEHSGNREFASAKNGILDSISALPDPEVAYFMEHFSKAYGMTLDQISE
jgi:5'-deoxynucleotidase